MSAGMTAAAMGGSGTTYSAGKYMPHTEYGRSATESMTVSPPDFGGMRGVGLFIMILAHAALVQKAIKLAKDYYKTNKKDYDFWKAYYRAPSAVTAAEAFSSVVNPTYVADLYASTPGGISKMRGVERKWFEARRRTHRYAVGAQRRLDYDMAVMRTSAVIAGWNMGRRYEINWADVHNDRAFNRKLAVANLGMAAGNQAMQGLATATGKLTQAYNDVGDELSSLGNGAYQHSGYNAGRQYAKDKYKQNTGEQNGT